MHYKWQDLLILNGLIDCKDIVICIDRTPDSPITTSIKVQRVQRYLDPDRMINTYDVAELFTMQNNSFGVLGTRLIIMFRPSVDPMAIDAKVLTDLTSE